MQIGGKYSHFCFIFLYFVQFRYVCLYRLYNYPFFMTLQNEKSVLQYTYIKHKKGGRNYVYQQMGRGNRGG